MKMFSQDGQCMVDVKKMEYVDGNIAMTAKLMGAYSMKIYLPPEELRACLSLMTSDVIKKIPDMLVTGTEGEDTLRAIGKNLASMGSSSLDVLFGGDYKEKLGEVRKAISANASATLLDSLLMLLPVIFANKEKKSDSR